MAARLLYFHLWKQSRKLWIKVSFELRENLCCINWFSTSWEIQFWNNDCGSIATGLDLRGGLLAHEAWEEQLDYTHHSLNRSCLIGWHFFLSTEPHTCVKHNCKHIPHSMCFMYSGKRHCKCIQACTSEQAKVCGSDGKTYRNECHLKRTACVNKKNVDVLKHGPCPVKLAGKGKEICLQFTEVSWIVCLCLKQCSL